MLSLVILISGNGSNLQAILDAVQQKKLNANISLVISNRADAYGLERAKKFGIKTEVCAFIKGETREQYDARLMQLIEPHQPDLIVLAGFMRILSPSFVDHFPHRILNIHPSLLPLYPGLHTHQQVIANRDQTHGCSIHIVTADLDGGPLIAQASLVVHSEETIETLTQRVHHLEHALYPLVLNWFAAKRIQLKKEGVYLDEKLLPSQGYIISEHDLFHAAGFQLRTQ